MGRNTRPGSLLSGLPTTVLSSISSAASSAANTVASVKRAAPDTPPQSRPAKKQKLEGLLGPGWEKYDATNVVPFYQKHKDVPEALKKYFYQRERYFSLYDQGCLLDEEGWYSVTPEGIADVIAEKCRCGTVLDAFCGVGGNAIAFARTCERVIAMDTSETRLRLARHNAVIYGVQDRIEFILGDYVAFVNAYVSLPEGSRRTIDVVFLSPPWGGMDYTSSPRTQESGKMDSRVSLTDGLSYNLERIKPLPGADLFHMTRRITPHIAYYLPRHINLQQVSDLLSEPSKAECSADGSQGQRIEGEGKIEVQEAWMGNKLKAVTCYFGGLVEGQEYLFPS
ncbi:RNA cap guanine-N2 methyltransferase-domain-containing protein [Gautieria morchelliformis]|nr:RNA cap guanine-N2 methyltransferase-domain-containing protein [Gautieria morchelliformis]